MHNPYAPGYSAGGSSSGCAVLVARGEVDMAIGGDQGGSIRLVSTPHCTLETERQLICSRLLNVVSSGSNLPTG